MKRWHQRNSLTMKEVVESMVEWQQGRCLDPGVWNHLRTRLNPRLMPAPSFLQPISPVKLELENMELEDSVRIVTRELVFKFENAKSAEENNRLVILFCQQETPYIVEMMSDEENTKSKISSDSDEEPLSKSVSKEKDNLPYLSAVSCSVTSGHGHRRINIPTSEGTLCFFYTKV